MAFNTIYFLHFFPAISEENSALIKQRTLASWAASDSHCSPPIPVKSILAFLNTS